MTEFKRKGHPTRTGAAGTVRDATCQIMTLIQRMGMPELYTEMAECLRDEMEAQGIFLDAPILLPSTGSVRQDVNYECYKDGWGDGISEATKQVRNIRAKTQNG